MLKKELKEMFRDKKSLSMMLIIPIMIPLLVLGLSALFDMQMNKDSEEYNKVGFAYELDETQKTLLVNMEIDFKEDSEENLENALANGEIDMYITREEDNYTFHSARDDKSSYTDSLRRTKTNCSLST